MKPDEISQQNLDLFHEFMMYALEEPEIFDKIPKGAQLVILPEDNPELYQRNLEIVNKRKEARNTENRGSGSSLKYINCKIKHNFK